MSSVEHELLREIAQKLDLLIGFAATVGRDTDAQIDVLTALGYGPAFIGPVVGTQTECGLSPRFPSQQKRR